MLNKQNGFTLVELAIALMVIGLLIGGVLKGQELIDNARVTSFIRQIKAYDTAAMIFKNTYGALPGDIKKPNRIPNCTAATTCLTAGNGDGKINSSISGDNAEEYNFFPHMTKAGMIQGPEGGTTADTEASDTHELFFPSSPFDLYVHAMYFATFRNGNTSTIGAADNQYLIPPLQVGIATANWPPTLPVKFMQQIDGKIDDDKPISGDVQVYDHGDCPVNFSANEYDLEFSSAYECSLVFRAGF